MPWYILNLYMTLSCIYVQEIWITRGRKKKNYCYNLNCKRIHSKWMNYLSKTGMFCSRWLNKSQNIPGTGTLSLKTTPILATASSLCCHLAKDTELHVNLWRALSFLRLWIYLGHSSFPYLQNIYFVVWLWNRHFMFVNPARKLCSTPKPCLLRWKVRVWIVYDVLSRSNRPPLFLRRPASCHNAWTWLFSPPLEGNAHTEKKNHPCSLFKLNFWPTFIVSRSQCPRSSLCSLCVWNSRVECKDKASIPL